LLREIIGSKMELNNKNSKYEFRFGIQVMCYLKSIISYYTNSDLIMENLIIN